MRISNAPPADALNAETTPFLPWSHRLHRDPAAHGRHRALQQANDQLDTVLVKARFWQRWAETPVNARQAKVLNRVLDGWWGEQCGV